jgi:hypothetical protein
LPSDRKIVNEPVNVHDAVNDHDHDHDHDYDLQRQNAERGLLLEEPSLYSVIEDHFM